MTRQELTFIREQAAQAYKDLPVDPRLEGDTGTVLTLEDRRLLAIFEASVCLLARQGFLAPGANELDHLRLVIRDFASVNEP